MAWAKQTEHLDLRTGYHVITLSDPETGHTHKLQIQTGADSCPSCGHVRPKTNHGQIDPKKHIEEELMALTKSHADQRAYAAKHRVKVRGAQ